MSTDTPTLPADRQALHEIEQILAAATIPVPWLRVVNLLRVVDAGLQERDGFRAELQRMQSPPESQCGGDPIPGAIPAPPADPDARILPMRPRKR